MSEVEPRKFISKQNTRNLVVSSPGPFAPWLHFLKSSGPLSAKADNVSRDRHPVASWQIYPVEGKQRHAIIHRKCVFLHCLRAKALGIEMVGSEGFVANLDFSSACFPCECWNTARVDGRLFGCMYYLRVQGVVWVEIDRFGAGVCFGMLSSVAVPSSAKTGADGAGQQPWRTSLRRELFKHNISPTWGPSSSNQVTVRA